jgi:hypothetical protein
MSGFGKRPSPADTTHPPPEAFAYDDDVTAEAVSAIEAKAKKIMKDGDWKVIEGGSQSK